MNTEFFAGLGQIFFLIVVLIGVLFLTYIFTKKLALFKQGSFSNKNIKIVEVTQLSPNQYLYIIEVAKHYYLFSKTKEKLEFCVELKKEDIIIDAQKDSSFESYLTKFLGNKQEKKDEKK